MLRPGRPAPPRATRRPRHWLPARAKVAVRICCSKRSSTRRSPASVRRVDRAGHDRAAVEHGRGRGERRRTRCRRLARARVATRPSWRPAWSPAGSTPAGPTTRYLQTTTPRATVVGDDDHRRLRYGRTRRHARSRRMLRLACNPLRAARPLSPPARGTMAWPRCLSRSCTTLQPTSRCDWVSCRSRSTEVVAVRSPDVGTMTWARNEHERAHHLGDHAGAGGRRPARASSRLSVLTSPGRADRVGGSYARPGSVHGLVEPAPRW